MASEPSVSVVLPTFNGEQFLAEQLQSIVGQTFSDFELLIVDDGSFDVSREIARRFAHEDSRVRLLPSRGNRGQKARLIELIAASKAPLIAISDQDDVWDKWKLERLASSLG